MGNLCIQKVVLQWSDRFICSDVDFGTGFLLFGSRASLHILQQEIAKTNALNDRFTNLAMPEPIKTALQRGIGHGLNQALLPPAPPAGMDPTSVFSPLSEKDLPATLKELTHNGALVANRSQLA